MTKKTVQVVLECDVQIKGTFDEVREWLKKYEEGYGPNERLSIVSSPDQYGFQHDIVLERPETDYEYEERLKKENSEKAKRDAVDARKREARRRKFEELKKEFGDD